MQVQSVNSNQAYNNTSNVDTQIKSISKQIESLQKQINDLQKEDNKSNSKVVQNQIKELQNEITQLNAEIAKLQSEKYSNKIEQKTEKQSETLDQKLVKCGDTMNNLKTQYATKIKLQGSANVLKSEIELDKGRGVDTTKKEEQLSNMKESISNIEKDMGKNIQKSLKEGNKEVILKEDEEDSENLNKYTEEDYKSNFIDEKA